MLLEEALSLAARPVAWIACTKTERGSGRLLIRILEAIARIAPGAADVLAERLAAAPQEVDALAAIRELTAELPRLLVEPLVLVIDDAENLEGAEESLRLLDELFRAERAALHVAAASRRPLNLRVAKPRAAGRLIEFTASELAFEAADCAALVRSRRGADPTPEYVHELMRATEGWPLGIGLAIASVGRAHGGADGPGELRNLRSGPSCTRFSPRSCSSRWIRSSGTLRSSRASPAL